MLSWKEHKSNIDHGTFRRAKVIDGWMVWSDYGAGRPGKMTFYSDPDHEWEGDLIDLA